MMLAWTVESADEFEHEFDELPQPVQDELLAHARVLERFGPELGRPRVDRECRSALRCASRAYRETQEISHGAYADSKAKVTTKSTPN